jgi:hypothetical protein
VNLERDRTRTIEPAPPPLKQCTIQAECQFEFLLCARSDPSSNRQEQTSYLGKTFEPIHVRESSLARFQMLAKSITK